MEFLRKFIFINYLENRRRIKSMLYFRIFNDLSLCVWHLPSFTFLEDSALGHLFPVFCLVKVGSQFSDFFMIKFSQRILLSHGTFRKKCVVSNKLENL